MKLHKKIPKSYLEVEIHESNYSNISCEDKEIDMSIEITQTLKDDIVNEVLFEGMKRLHKSKNTNSNRI